MVACSHNHELETTYLRIIQLKPSKMIEQVAIQPKLLRLTFTLWKNSTTYMEDSQKKLARTQKAQATPDSSVLELL